MSTSGPLDPRLARQGRFLLAAAAALSTAGLLAYSQTHAFGWDEGYHLLAAQLIRAGKAPYLNFCFPQTPVAAYWNAGWMSLFGEHWRVVHAASALCAAAATLLAAGFVLRRMPDSSWRTAGAISTAVLIIANTTVVQFATTGQPYGLCLLLIVAAFICATAAVHRTAPLLAAAAGAFAGAAAASSLLTASVVPVLLVWMILCNQAGGRLAKAGWFAAGVLVSWAPVIWLFVQGPRQVFFNVVEYMLLYRRAEWPGATRHDLEVVFSLFESPQGLALGFLGAAGFFWGARRPNALRWRHELRLCFCLVTALAVHVSLARPTFPQYYLFTVPFLAIAACAGLYGLSSRLGGRPLWTVIAVAAVICGGLAKRLYDEARNDFFWRDMEAVARQVEAVTPRSASLLASEEHIYFLTRRPPPPGMEVEDSHGIPAPPADAALLHLVSRDQLRKQMEAGMFDTVEVCEEDPDRVHELGLEQIYARHAVILPCYIYWERAGSAKGRAANGPALHR
ncbi:MAG TPA: hypothetical protein VKT49_10700 [Bryobacteraceae bacterium]|nr:hypothetical protein [Bryobacteraceae bacterium]